MSHKIMLTHLGISICGIDISDDDTQWVGFQYISVNSLGIKTGRIQVSVHIDQDSRSGRLSWVATVLGQHTDLQEDDIQSFSLSQIVSHIYVDLATQYGDIYLSQHWYIGFKPLPEPKLIHKQRCSVAVT